jgi:hypothetical protein
MVNIQKMLLMQLWLITGAQIKSIKEGYDSLHIKNVKEAADKENSIEQAKFDLK